VRSFFSFSLFLIFSVLEVRVKASNPEISAGPTLQKPQNCYMTSEVSCAFSSGHQVLRLEEKSISLSLKENTTLERISPTKYEFMGGVVWFQNRKPLEVKSLFGSISSDDGEFWMIEKKNKIFVRNVLGSLKIKMNGQTLEIPEGFQIWISGKNTTGLNTHGIPELIPMENHLKLWSELFVGTRDEFKGKVSLLKNLYKDNHLASSDLYQKIADRHMASLEETKKSEREVQQRRKEYLLEIRRLYFDKVFRR